MICLLFCDAQLWCDDCSVADRPRAAVSCASRRRQYHSLDPSLPHTCARKRWLALSEGQMHAQVGQQFVEQYYDVMKNQPHLLHRFYTDHSTVTYCEPDVPAQVIGTQRVRASSICVSSRGTCAWHMAHKLLGCTSGCKRGPGDSPGPLVGRAEHPREGHVAELPRRGRNHPLSGRAILPAAGRYRAGHGVSADPGGPCHPSPIGASGLPQAPKPVVSCLVVSRLKLFPPIDEPRSNVQLEFSATAVDLLTSTPGDLVQGGPKREFVQTFFLAVQTKGYFVLNDVFRILPEAQQPPPPPPQLSAFSSAPSGPQENGYPPAPQHLAHPPQVCPFPTATRCPSPS